MEILTEAQEAVWGSKTKHHWPEMDSGQWVADSDFDCRVLLDSFLVTTGSLPACG